MLKRVHTPFRTEAGPQIAVQKLVLGKPVEEAAALLPRVFNLCRTAQSACARLAFGLPLPDTIQADLARDIAREHCLHLAILLPSALNTTPLDPAQTMQPVRFPDTVDGFEALLKGHTLFAPLLRHLTQTFGPGEASACALPLPSAQNVFSGRPLENSVAARHEMHPVMQHIAARAGRGPLWRVVGRILDLKACQAGVIPAPSIENGVAVVPAARGLYAIRATILDGCVSTFERRTPTDHLQASGGVLQQSMATLAPADRASATALLSILDPCYPLTLKEGPTDA